MQDCLIFNQIWTNKLNSPKKNAEISLMTMVIMYVMSVACKEAVSPILFSYKHANSHVVC